MTEQGSQELAMWGLCHAFYRREEQDAAENLKRQKKKKDLNMVRERKLYMQYTIWTTGVVLLFLPSIIPLKLTDVYSMNPMTSILRTVSLIGRKRH